LVLTLCHWKTPQLLNSQFPTIYINDMADTRTFEVEPTLAPLTEESESKCQLWKENEESVDNITPGFPTLAKKE